VTTSWLIFSRESLRDFLAVALADATLTLTDPDGPTGVAPTDDVDGGALLLEEVIIGAPVARAAMLVTPVSESITLFISFISHCNLQSTEKLHTHKSPIASAPTKFARYYVIST
jgi:hypothetical protein